MVVVHVLVLISIALLGEVVFGSDRYQTYLWRVDLDRKPINCKSCLTFWLTFAYSWIFLFPISWSLVTGFTLFALSVEGYTERFVEWMRERLR